MKRNASPQFVNKAFLAPGSALELAGRLSTCPTEPLAASFVSLLWGQIEHHYLSGQVFLWNLSVFFRKSPKFHTRRKRPFDVCAARDGAGESVRNLLESVPDSILSKAADGQIESANAAFRCLDSQLERPNARSADCGDLRLDDRHFRRLVLAGCEFVEFPHRAQDTKQRPVMLDRLKGGSLDCSHSRYAIFNLTKTIQADLASQTPIYCRVARRSNSRLLIPRHFDAPNQTAQFFIDVAAFHL